MTYLPTYHGCYVCGQEHARGLRAHFYLGENGQVHTQFTPDASQTSYRNIVHGGIVSSLLDEVLGWPAAVSTGHFFFTGELSVRFTKPMTIGRTYLVTAYPGEERGKFWECKGDVRDEKGQVYAQGQGKYFQLSIEQTAALAAELTYGPDDLPIFRDLVTQKGE